MKLFLASSLDKTLPLLLKRIEKPAQELKVLFIPNAADPMENAWWVDLDKKAFRNEGCQIAEIDLRKISTEELTKQIENADILHVCGGSVFYLLSLLKEKGFDQVIIDSVRNNKILYTGTSAGSIICASTAWLYLFDVEEAKFAEGMKDLSGLRLVNFLIIPHCENPRFTESNKNMIVENLPKHSDPVFLLYDSQAVWVEDEKFELLSNEL
ncbi:MAG: Type 1 glutamine amidotransferase-like domain-containing protein [Candidatus Yanofskybacteria bacterium]|nr:Type 1 glutamine amidotransferase-like domain-containing protein [Candidatus Yanofskybacteria bacterium]